MIPIDQNKKRLLVFMAGQVSVVCMIAALGLYVNSGYQPQAPQSLIRQVFLRNIHIASPANIYGSRNIAFETGNAMTNMPAGYITSGNCCEYDESLARRQVYTSLSATVIKKKEQP